MNPQQQRLVALLTAQLCLSVVCRLIRRLAIRRAWRMARLRWHLAVRRARLRNLEFAEDFDLAVLQTRSEQRATRRWWVYPRPDQLWNVYARVIWEDEQWVTNFRMSRATFNWLVDRLRPHIQRQSTRMREPIPVDERVAIAISWLSSTSSYIVVGSLFGVARSTVAVIVIEVCLAIEAYLLSDVVCLRSPGRVMQGFWEMGFPHCVGAMDGCHIQIMAPAHQPTEYFNRKHDYSVLLQGTVDHQGRFIDVTIGEAGKSHDAHTLRRSRIMDAMDRGIFVPGNPTVTVEGVQIPPLIIADAAYPTRRWLITPYTGALTPRQRVFNRAHCRARCVVERAFGRLKARWRCLGIRLPVREENINCIITACVVLHNICEERGHPAPAEDSQQQSTPRAAQNVQQGHDRHRVEGQAVREALTRWFNRQRR